VSEAEDELTEEALQYNEEAYFTDITDVNWSLNLDVS